MWLIQTPEVCVGDWWHLPVPFTVAGWVSGHTPGALERVPQGLSVGWGRLGEGG